MEAVRTQVDLCNGLQWARFRQFADVLVPVHLKAHSSFAIASQAQNLASCCVSGRNLSPFFVAIVLRHLILHEIPDNDHIFFSKKAVGFQETTKGSWGKKWKTASGKRIWSKCYSMCRDKKHYCKTKTASNLIT